MSSLAPGALSLLALAAGAYGDGLKQRARDIIDGSVLARIFDLATRLPDLCRNALSGSASELEAAIGPHRMPKTLFDFFVALHDTLWQEIAEKAKRGPDRLTGFDHAAFLANFQTFLFLLDGSDGVGPAYRDAVRRIAGLSPGTIQRRLIANYFGNLLQDYFETASIRRSNPGLPADREARLRDEDAAGAAEIVFAEAAGADPLSWPVCQAAARRFLAAVELLERDEHARPG